MPAAIQHIEKNVMTCYDVQLNQLESVPLAVVRRQANARDLARVVPECCGLVWNVVRAQKTEAGRHVAIYWDGSIRLEVGVELIGPFAEDGEVVRSSTPAGAVASTTHYGPYRRPRRSARCCSPVVCREQSPSRRSQLGDIRSLANRVE